MSDLLVKQNHFFFLLSPNEGKEKRKKRKNEKRNNNLVYLYDNGYGFVTLAIDGPLEQYMVLFLLLLLLLLLLWFSTTVEKNSTVGTREEGKPERLLWHVWIEF